MEEQENIRTPSKFCEFCGVEHPLTNEYWYINTNKACKKKIMYNSKMWRKANQEKAKESVKRWREANPDKNKACTIRCKKANPKKYIDKLNEWKKNNPQKVSLYERKKILNIVDSYVASIMGKKLSEIPPEIIETKRNIIKIKRLINNLKTQENGN